MVETSSNTAPLTPVGQIKVVWKHWRARQPSPCVGWPQTGSVGGGAEKQGEEWEGGPLGALGLCGEGSGPWGEMR